ncbi:Ribosome biogenesis protein erb1 [Elasticomyces elasticus]|nr:Ribosome biogenesis protein erb1 [Elasticomyces elasticus]KAK3658207.1 Ribosome biogenesis protein erb1 [Elasticomyces elasticus]KAK4919486.1 Ribosome biogenesis protein erb1 [Elasticomyces elasticus]KAK5764092.1 Ribosome biogenesis protein erb1 [Elasticomyces elasticus]
MSQRAGQKRKVVEVPAPEIEEDADQLDIGALNGDFEGESEEDADEESEEDEDELEDDDELASDEIPPSEDEEEVRQQFQDMKTTNGHSKSAQSLMGSDTAKDVATIATDTPITPLNGDDAADVPNYTVSTDANGNPRYIHGEIDPVYDSDDSDAVEPGNTIGNIPMSYYDAYPHIGYDINGRRIARPAKGEALDSLLDSIDIPEGWTGLTDPATGKPLELTPEQLETLKKLTRNETPGDGYDPYPDMVEWFTGKGKEEVMPLSAIPEPKRRFVPSAHEHKRVMKMVKAIREGRIKPYRAPLTEEEREREEEEQDFATYDVWATEQPREDHVMNIPAPKLPPPGYEESYHPPPEYLPDDEEKKTWEEQDDEDRNRDFLPRDHAALRKVPGYEQFVKEKFERCLDLYLAPRVRRSKLNIDPESLLPKLPDPAELKPFPTTNTTIMRGHEGKVRSISIDGSGKWVASGGDDGTVRVWEILTGRQLWRLKLSKDEAVNVVSWRPGNAESSILVACCGESIYFMTPQHDLCTPEVDAKSRGILDAGYGYAATAAPAQKTSAGADKPTATSWARPSATLQERGCLLSLTLRTTPKTLSWHRRGDYFSTVSPGSSSASATAIAIHTLSKHQTQYPRLRLRGLAQTTCFHPSKPLFFVATKVKVRIYDLQAQKMEKELLPGARWISDIALHPLGSNLIISSYDKRLLWHDLDLGATPYRVIRHHTKAIRAVAFHPGGLPLFADASDDGTLHILHGKVVGDSLENATIVPLKVLKGHRVVRELGVLGVEWHPREAWCVSAGADGTIRVWT